MTRVLCVLLTHSATRTFALIFLSIKPPTDINIRRTSTTDRVAYWDKGDNEIERFKAQHKTMCSDNWVCNRLHLATLEVARPDSGTLVKQEEVLPRPLRHGQLFLMMKMIFQLTSTRMATICRSYYCYFRLVL